MDQKSPNQLMVLLAFFLSGLAGLMYEISWIREASLLFGATLPAITAVTTVFFGGMALGNWKYSSVETITTTTYRKLELLIGIFALLSIAFFNIAEPLSAAIYPNLNNVFLLFVYRVVVITVIIGPATFLIGATWPVMVRIFKESTFEGSQKVAQLYGVNSIGAVAGTLLTGVVLIPVIGTMGTIILGAIVNITVASIFPKYDVAPVKLMSNKSKESNGVFYYALAFLIGFAAMDVQIVWSRFLSLVLHNTVYTYTITIATVILGIVIGALLSIKLLKKGIDVKRSLSILIITTSAVLVGTLYLPASMWKDIGAQESVSRIIAAVSILMLIPSICSGMLYPLLVELAKKSSAPLSSVAGKLTAANTFGGILGSSIAGFILLPLLGIGHSIEITIAVYLAMAVITALKFKLSPQLWVLFVIPVALLARLHRPADTFIEEYVIPRGYQTVAIVEGETATVTAFEKQGLTIMEIDRLWQGENRVNRQIMAAHIPMMMAPGKPSNVMVIGLGAGATAKRFTLYGVDSLELVDIEPAVFQIARDEFDGGWMDSSGIEEIVADGRTHLKYSEETYDLVSVEIGQMFRPYSATFYTREFYEDVKEHLSANGMISQFIPIASFDDETFKRAIATFVQVFPKAQLWYNNTEFILLGFNGREGKITSPWARQWFEVGATDVFEDLRFSYYGGRTYNLNNQLTFAAGYLLGSNELEALADDRRAFTDAVPELEYFASRNQQNVPFVKQLASYLSPISYIVPGIPSSVVAECNEKRAYNLGDIYAAGLYREYMTIRDIRILEEARSMNPHNLSVNIELLDQYLKAGTLDKAFEPYKVVRQLSSNSDDVSYLYIESLIDQGMYQVAVDLLLDMVNLHTDDFKAHSLLAGVLAQLGRYDLAWRHVSVALEINDSFGPAVQTRDYLITIMPESARVIEEDGEE